MLTNLFKTTKTSAAAAMAISKETQTAGAASKKRAGFLGVQLTPGVIFGTIAVASFLVTAGIMFVSENQEHSRLDMAANEVIELHHAAQTYSLKATDFSTGFNGINPDTIAPWIKTNMALDDTTVGGGDDSFFCSATPYGCKIKYWMTTDGSDDSYGIYVDASAAFPDADLMSQYETSTHKGLKRISPNVLLDGDALATTASGAAGAEAANDGDGKFELYNLY